MLGRMEGARPPRVPLAPVRRVVALPGMDGTGRLLAPFARAARGWLEVVPVAYPPDAVDYDAFTQAAAEVVARERGDFVLLAESFSGPVALALARRAGPALRGLVLVAALVAPPSRPLWRLVTALPLERLLGLRLPGALPAAFLLGWRPPAAARALLDDVIATWSPTVLAGRIRQLGAIPPLGPPLPLPALYLRPTCDLVLPSGALHAARQALPALVVRPLAGPHALLAARPDEAAARIADFVARLAPSGSAAPGERPEVP
jgi:pimeloyl-ACP methyl ester carboxylesterase